MGQVVLPVDDVRVIGQIAFSGIGRTNQRHRQCAAEWLGFPTRYAAARFWAELAMLETAPGLKNGNFSNNSGLIPKIRTSGVDTRPNGQ